jgi:hypothetical protein
MFVFNVRDCIGTVWLNTLRRHGWPAILQSYFMYLDDPWMRCTPYLAEVYLLSFAVVGEPIQVGQDDRPCLLSCFDVSRLRSRICTV